MRQQRQPRPLAGCRPRWFHPMGDNLTPAHGSTPARGRSQRWSADCVQAHTHQAGRRGEGCPSENRTDETAAGALSAEGRIAHVQFDRTRLPAHLRRRTDSRCKIHRLIKSTRQDGMREGREYLRNYASGILQVESHASQHATDLPLIPRSTVACGVPLFIQSVCNGLLR
jgi:hypothetical protein